MKSQVKYAKNGKVHIAYPWAPTREEHEAAFVAYEKHWGTPIGFKMVAPSVANDEQCRNWWARNLRMGASPASGVALYRMNIEIDIRGILPSIRVPTLILHREGDRLINVENSRYMAARISGAKYCELKGVDHLPWFGDAEAVLGQIEEFLTGVRPGASTDRDLSTILFVDVVGSTEAGEILVSRTVRDLVAGSGLHFVSRGRRALKGFPDEWELYAAEERA